MKKFWKNINNIPYLVIGVCLILFLPGFFAYFSQDDFIHLSYSETFRQVINAFNLFHKGEFPFYRPIPTEVYFYINKLIFGFNPLGYHAINFIIFSLNIILIYKLIRLICSSRKIAAFSILFYGINTTHFAPLYSPAYIHELIYVFFGVLCAYNFIKWFKESKLKYYLSAISFLLLSLMSKETAVVLPLILAIIYFTLIKNHNWTKAFKIFFIPFIVLFSYLFGHFFFYGLANNSSYRLIIGKQNMNILIWYFLWALSTPNILIDFVGPGFRLNKIFLDITHINGWVYLITFPIFSLMALFLSISFLKNRHLNETKKLFILGILLFIVGLFPLIIFPLHKLATEQAYSLVWLSMSLGIITDYFVTEKKSIISFLFLFLYLVIAINSIIVARRTHWIVTSGKQAHNVIDYFQKNYRNLSANSVIYFKNGLVKIPEYGSSRQIYYALGNGVGLKIILKKPDLQLYFEDINPLPGEYRDQNIILVDSSKFLGY